jgi:hypothetical protein
MVPNCKHKSLCLPDIHTHLRRSHRSHPLLEQLLRMFDRHGLALCMFCEKVLANQQSLDRHLIKCKGKQTFDQKVQNMRDNIE